MPLNRTLVMPPKDLFDLVSKMREGFYDIDTEVIREKYRVVTPAITDYTTIGFYISKECASYPTYKLEKLFNPGEIHFPFN